MKKLLLLFIILIYPSHLLGENINLYCECFEIKVKTIGAVNSTTVESCKKDIRSIAIDKSNNLIKIDNFSEVKYIDRGDKFFFDMSEYSYRGDWEITLNRITGVLSEYEFVVQTGIGIYHKDALYNCKIVEEGDKLF